MIRFHTEPAVSSLDFAKALGIGVEGDKSADESVSERRRTFGFAQMTGGNREDIRACNGGCGPVDELRDVLAAVADRARCRSRPREPEDLPAKLGRAGRGRVIRMNAVEIVHHDRVAGVPSGLLEGTPRERILVQQLAEPVFAAHRRGERAPVCRIRCVADVMQPVPYLAQPVVEPVDRHRPDDSFVKASGGTG